MAADERKRTRKSVAGGSGGQSARTSGSQRPDGSSWRDAPINTRSTTQRRASGKTTNTSGSRVKSSRAKSKTSKKKTWNAKNVDIPGALAIIGKAIISSRVATIIVAVVLVLAVGGIWDTVSNWEKSYGNVTVNGINVGGMTKQEIVEVLDGEYTSKIRDAKVTIYASEEAMNAESSEVEDAERVAQAEEVSVEEADAAVTEWQTNVYDLGGSMPYEEVADKALEAGRHAGPFGRLGVMLFGSEIPLQVQFDEAKLEDFAATVDKTIGDPRIDATVALENGAARPVEGKQGVMVDRNDFAKKISDSMLGISGSSSFIAEAVAAPSRTTYEQAQQTSDGINRSIAAGATFTYENDSWTASPEDLASWTKVEVKEADNGYELVASINEDAAIPAVVKGVKANVTSEDVTVSIAKFADEIIVSTSGDGEIPLVAPAVQELGVALYGEDGKTFSDTTASSPGEFAIETTNAPGALTFDEAVDLGILTVIGEYTTEFSNYEGTENRNHNIRTVADILNDTIIEANGGEWSYNDHSGDTTKDPPFASAGSIIGGEHVDSIGGGICQVATTVFNAVFEAGMPVSERHNHTEHMRSYPDGRDAAVSYGELDLRWVNDTPSDIILKMSYTDHSVTARLYSVYTGRTVTSEQGEWIMGEIYTTKFEESDWLSAGQYYTDTAGEDGSSITVTRKVTDESGEVLIDESYTSVYQPKKEVIIVGPGTDTEPLAHKADDEDEGASW
ncbi:MAG: VanW family protein [Exiguobacterium sp.]|nr:VanW family protein [Exiguobacterium sp.]